MHAQLEPVVAAAKENRRRFESFCRSLTDAQLEAPIAATTWRVKDYIAHLATIDIWVGEWFEHQAEGRPWRPRAGDGGAFNIDDWNEARIQERLDTGVEDLLGEAAGHRARLWAAVDRFTDEVLEQRFEFHERTITFLRYLQLWVAHDPAHAADMLRGLPELSGEADLREWIAKHSIPLPA